MLYQTTHDKSLSYLVAHFIVKLIKPPFPPTPHRCDTNADGENEESFKTKIRGKLGRCQSKRYPNSSVQCLVKTVQIASLSRLGENASSCIIKVRKTPCSDLILLLRAGGLFTQHQ